MKTLDENPQEDGSFTNFSFIQSISENDGELYAFSTQAAALRLMRGNSVADVGGRGAVGVGHITLPIPSGGPQKRGSRMGLCRGSWEGNFFFSAEAM